MGNFIKEIINTKINFLKHSYNSNKMIKHQGVKGSLNEILLLEIIRDVIPKKYKLTRGIIQDYNGVQSNESDIIIYDESILPTLLFGNDLGFVPSESVNYLYEVKSTLTVKELKTTINKFNNSNNLKGYQAINVLFAFASDLKKDRELERYYKIEKDNFLIRPSIQVLTVSNKVYYFHHTEKIFLKNFMDKNEFAKLAATNIMQTSNGEIKIGEQTLKFSSDTDISFEIDGDVVINDLNYEEIYITFYKWYGIDKSINNCEILSLLSGISNTLSQESFGKYLMSSCQDIKCFAHCVQDMWGNISFEHKNFKGYDYSDFSEISFTFVSDKIKGNKLTINKR